jgi:hypothetical protein
MRDRTIPTADPHLLLDAAREALYSLVRAARAWY